MRHKILYADANQLVVITESVSVITVTPNAITASADRSNLGIEEAFNPEGVIFFGGDVTGSFASLTPWTSNRFFYSGAKSGGEPYTALFDLSNQTNTELVDLQDLSLSSVLSNEADVFFAAGTLTTNSQPQLIKLDSNGTQLSRQNTDAVIIKMAPFDTAD